MDFSKMELKEIVDIALNASQNAYAPYSNYHVGACVICKDGSKFIGANIENAAYGSTMCAERNALYAAYSNGYRKDDIEILCIVCYGKHLASPCGACRQVIAELVNENTKIVLANNEYRTHVCLIDELLPNAFIGGNLDV